MAITTAVAYATVYFTINEMWDCNTIIKDTNDSDELSWVGCVRFLLPQMLELIKTPVAITTRCRYYKRMCPLISIRYFYNITVKLYEVSIKNGFPINTIKGFRIFWSRGEKSIILRNFQ